MVDFDDGEEVCQAVLGELAGLCRGGMAALKID